MPIIKLVSSDNELFPVDVEIVKCSGTIKTMLETCGIEDVENTVVPLPNVSSKILLEIITWVTHKNDPQRTSDESTWVEKFGNGTLIEVLQAADYLNIKGLVEFLAKFIANKLKGKTAGEMREILNISQAGKEEVQIAEEK